MLMLSRMSLGGEGKLNLDTKSYFSVEATWGVAEVPEIMPGAVCRGALVAGPRQQGGLWLLSRIAGRCLI